MSGKNREKETEEMKRRNIYWPVTIDELADQLARDQGFDSTSEMLRELVVRESKNPTIFSEKSGGKHSTLRALVKNLIHELQNEAGQTQKQGLGKIKDAFGKK